jgi:F0F1-type ATP synthase delta subunit
MSARFTRPYVDAFFAVAEDPALELAALDAFRDAFNRAPELVKVLENPGLDRQKREALLASVAARVGVPEVGSRLLRILLVNRRLRFLGELLAAIRARLDASLERRLEKARAALHALAPA